MVAYQFQCQHVYNSHPGSNTRGSLPTKVFSTWYVCLPQEVLDESSLVVADLEAEWEEVVWSSFWSVDLDSS